MKPEARRRKSEVGSRGSKKLKLFLPCLACVGLLLAGGCASILKIATYNSDTPRRNEKVFWATTGDLDILRNVWKQVDLPFAVPAALIAVLDLPFSLATDILMLPLDFYWDAARDEQRKARNLELNETPDPQ